VTVDPQDNGPGRLVATQRLGEMGCDWPENRMFEFLDGDWVEAGTCSPGFDRAQWRDEECDPGPTTMPEPQQDQTHAFPTPADFEAWLREHHDSETELWLKIFKKASGEPSVTWEQAVIEALCWGWIDGVKKSLDASAYLQRFTPRRKRSNWSKRNVEHVERLIAGDRMREQGMVHVRTARADGRWDAAYTASEMVIPADFLDALEARPKAKAFFATLTKTKWYPIAYGLSSAKRPETRQRRFDKFIAKLEAGEPLG
jgi:uncharacterized protein YdeI (YjbR/CyaY-like superfamily)